MFRITRLFDEDQGWRSRLGIATLALIILSLSCARHPDVPPTSPREEPPREIEGIAMDQLRRAIEEGAAELEIRVGRARFSLVRIPPGEFDMGSFEAEKGHMANEGPVRHIRISKPFYLGRYEVTQLEYEVVMGKRPRWFREDSAPAYGIKYTEALEFCCRLSQVAGVSITLPTEAQWEYACRAGTHSRYYSGEAESDLDKVGWYKGNSGGRVHPVGEKQPNCWGLYDMHGNVWEPCIDCCFDREQLAGTDPLGKRNTTYGAMRGGGWGHDAEYCRSATSLVTDEMFGDMGIRIAIRDGQGKR